jgi:5-deoxy-glucuronate isomerase
VTEAVPATRWHRRAGDLAEGPWELALSPEEAGWSFSGLRVATLPAGGEVAFDTGLDEVEILPLAGSFGVDCDGSRAELSGRSSVFAGPSDFAYAPPGTRVTVSSVGGGRFAVPAARAERGRPFRRVAATDVQIELRGAGSMSREVRNFAAADAFDAERLIAVEVLTPSGNWGSYPPHKHDEARPGETVLEEIYFYEVAAGPSGGGIAYQRVYGTPERPIDVLAEVRSGDVVLIPHGWHGPAMAPPGYDLYYLNVMAGPGERAWLACDDPAHAWVRDAWREEAVDARLPFGRSDAS